MAVPEYFGRNAVAAAQAISGLDEHQLTTLLENVRVGITIGRDAAGKEGRALTDLLVRLVARLYPTLAFRADSRSSLADDAAALATRINPRVELTESPTVEVVVGSARSRRWAPHRIFVGSQGWNATISHRTSRVVGKSDLPYGAGAAACLAASNLFRFAFLPESKLDEQATFAVLPAREAGRANLAKPLGEVVLAGAGAIGNAAAWALSRTPMKGTIAIVDPEMVDLGNLQRYVLANRTDEGIAKPLLVARYFAGPVLATPYQQDLASFAETRSHRIEHLLLALDSARDRRAGQAILPRWIENAWTQPGDLGVSTHDFLEGACVSCLYLPDGTSLNEDSIIAEAFGVPSRLMQIRLLLHRAQGVPRDLLEAIASAHDVSMDVLLPFEGRPVRALYAEGFCGGAVIPLSRIGAPRSELHVPLAHQSALAGVLLAAAAVRRRLNLSRGTEMTQIDVLRALPPSTTRVAAKHPQGICICQDPDYRRVYQEKFQVNTPSGAKVQVRATRARKLVSKERGSGSAGRTA